MTDYTHTPHKSEFKFPSHGKTGNICILDIVCSTYMFTSFISPTKITDLVVQSLVVQ